MGEIAEFFCNAAETDQHGSHTVLVCLHRLGKKSDAFVTECEGKIIAGVTITFDAVNVAFLANGCSLACGGCRMATCPALPASAFALHSASPLF